MKKTGCVLLGVFVLLCMSVFVNFLFIASYGVNEVESVATRRARSELQQIEIEAGEKGGGKIAVIPIQGIIQSNDSSEWGTSMVDSVKEALQEAMIDDEVKGVVLAMNSPGGEVTASDEIYNEVRKVQKEKPVVVSMGSLAASGAYYIACGADWIVANETTFTGSIGVIIQSLNYEGLFNKVGLGSVVFKSGKFKDMLSGARPMSVDEKAYVEGMVMQVYDRFLGIVSKARNIPAEELRKGLADGRIITGLDAQKAKLADQLGYIEDAYDKARELANAPDATIIRYEPRMNLQRIFRLLGANMKTKMELQIAPVSRLQLQPGCAYLLPEFYVW